MAVLKAAIKCWKSFLGIESVKIITQFIYKQFIPTLIFWSYLTAILLGKDLIEIKIGTPTVNGEQLGLNLLKKLDVTLFNQDIFIAIFLTILSLFILCILFLAILKNISFKSVLDTESYFQEGVSQLNSLSAIFILLGFEKALWNQMVDWKLVNAGIEIGLVALFIHWIIRRFFTFISESKLPDASEK